MQPNDTEHDTAHSQTSLKAPFFVLVAGAIAVSLGLVVVSMYLYNMSGAAQLDLSLPGLQQEAARAQQSKRYDDFAPAGKINSRALQQFDELYTHQQQDIQRDTQDFTTKPLDDDQLGISVQ